MTQDEWRPHKGPQENFMSRKEDVVLYQGGKGSGKSDALLIEALRQIENPNYKALLIRRNYPQLQELIDRAHLIYPRVGGKWQGDIHRFTFPKGSYVRFGHCASEVDKEGYQGHELSFIGFDQLEQFTESQFNFIVAQNRSSDPTIKCYVRCTANPGGIGHWFIKRRFIDNKEPGKTYVDTYELPDGRTVTRTFCHIRATVYDNPTLIQAQPTYLANLMSLPDAEKRAYLEGDWNAFTSECVFDQNGLKAQESKIKSPVWTGFLKETHESFTIVPDTTGNLKIWEEARDGEVYEIGVDVAEGDKSGDYSSAHVVNKKNWNVVAVWHGHRNPLEFANIIDTLGRYYNNAEVAVEVPGPGIATVGKLVELGYPTLYKYDTDKFGWRTDVSTRNHLIATLLDAVRGSHVIVHDRDTLDEMYNLIRNPRTMKIEAREGTFDDRMLSLGIALQCIRVNPYFEPKRKDALFSRRLVSAVSNRPVQGRRKATGYG